MTTRRLAGLGPALLLPLLLVPPPARAQRPPGAAELRDQLAQLDANGDRVIERDEVPESGRAAFDRLLRRGDADGDGKLDADEVAALLSRARPEGRPGTPGRPGAIANRFRAMDRDGDGKVSREEFTGPAAAFERLDTNKDGSITREELARARPPMPAPGARRPADPAMRAERLRRLDRDGDGKVSRDEFPGAEALFERLDTNKDGVLSPDDRPAAPSPAGRPGEALRQRRLMAMDRDGDGKVSREEFTGPAAAFERLDTNKDGVLSPEDRREARPSGPRARR